MSCSKRRKEEEVERMTGDLIDSNSRAPQRHLTYHSVESCIYI